MCHPDKPFTPDKLQCVFNEYKATVWVPPRLHCLSCAPLPEEKIDLWAGERNICPSQKRREEISRAIGGE